MKKVLFLVSLLGLELFALSLDDVISQALAKNPSLESIEHRITANKFAQDISTQFANPSVAFTANTIDASQAMSQKTITIGQKLPFYGKREALLESAQADKAILDVTLTQAKVDLVKAIKNQAYTIWELEELLGIIAQYEEITKQNIELSESYTSTSKNQHMGIMSAELSLTDLKIQRSELKSKIFTAYAKLSYLAAFKVDKLTIDITIDAKMPDLKSLKAGLVHNVDLQKKDKEIAKNQAMIHIADINNYPDINLVGGYSYRANYNNYMTFGFGLSIPMYGTEDYKEEEQRAFILSSRSLKSDTNLKIDAEFMSVYMQMQSAYEIYHLIHDDALPQIAHMFDLTNSNISTGGDLFKYIDILIQKLKLEQKSISAVTNYNRANAKISALRGELK